MSDKEINEEQKTEESQEQQETGQQLSAKDIRESKVFKSAITEAQRYKAELQKIKEQMTSQEEQKRKAELEERGEYDRLINEAKERNLQLQSQIEKMTVEFNLKDSLRRSGVNHPILLKHSIREFSGTADDIETYVQTIVEDEQNAIFFNAETKQPTMKPPVVKQPAQRGQEKTLDERIANGDVEAMNQKLKEMMGLTP